MAAALECWSGRPSTDEETIEQVLMKTNHRSEAFPPLKPSASSPSVSFFSSTTPTSAVQPPANKWHRFSRSFAGAISALNESKLSWSGVVRSLAQLLSSNQLSDKLISDIHRHFDSLPNSYSQAGFNVKDVVLHLNLVDQVAADGLPAFQIKPISGERGGGQAGLGFKLTFACNSSFSWPMMSNAIIGSVICFNKIQIYEKKGLVLGVVIVVIHPGGEKQFRSCVDAVLKSASKKQRNSVVKLTFSLCGCQEEGTRGLEEDPHFATENPTSSRRTHLRNPLPESSLVISINEWQSIRSNGDELGRWLLVPDDMKFVQRTGASSFTGSYKGKKVWIKKLKGCEHEIEIRRDLMQLMSCGQKTLLHFHGICMDDDNGVCVVTKLMEGGSVHDLIEKKKKVPIREVMRTALDVAEGLEFMNGHGVSYRDLNRKRILLDQQGNACIGDMGIVSSCKNDGEVTEYETTGYRWLAPEIISGDPETVAETSMSNVYSFGMVLWEMLTGEAAFSSCSPVQAAVGIATCGLRPEIPSDCPPALKSLMLSCWKNRPSERPLLSEIIAILRKHNGC